MSRLQRLHEAAAHLAATTPDMLTHPEVARAIEQGLVHALVCCLADSTTAEASAPARTRLPVMEQFEEVLAENPGRPLYLAEICAALAVSDRTLRLHCLEHVGMGPHRYLWLRRMHLARCALARADPRSTTVTVIANDHGFGELGRFAVAYQRLFGESPSVTLRRERDLPRPLIH